MAETLNIECHDGRMVPVNADWFRKNSKLYINLCSDLESDNHSTPFNVPCPDDSYKVETVMTYLQGVPNSVFTIHVLLSVPVSDIVDIIQYFNFKKKAVYQHVSTLYKYIVAMAHKEGINSETPNNFYLIDHYYKYMKSTEAMLAQVITFQWAETEILKL